MTSSGVFPSTSLAMFSISSRPHFSLALMNWLKSRLFQIVNPLNGGTVGQNMHKLEQSADISSWFVAHWNQYLLQQVLLLLELLLCESLSFVNLRLLFFLDLGWIRHVRITWNLQSTARLSWRPSYKKFQLQPYLHKRSNKTKQQCTL